MIEFLNDIKNNVNGLLIIVGSLLTGLFLLTLYRKNRTREYRKQLFNAFSPELNRILQTNDDCMHILDSVAYTKHETAVNNLMAHVGFIEKFRLKRKWRCLAMMGIDKKTYAPAYTYTQYSDTGSSSVREKVRPVVIKRIQDIISFAKK